MKVLVLAELDEQRHHWLLEQSLLWRRDGKAIVSQDASSVTMDDGSQVQMITFSTSSGLATIGGLTANEVLLTVENMAHPQIVLIKSTIDSSVLIGPGTMVEEDVPGGYKRFKKK